jgi:hypothetical protein
MIIGIALRIVKEPAATNPTTIEVVVEELWIKLVVRIPINKATKGLLVVRINSWATSLPKILKDVLKREMLRRKR